MRQRFPGFGFALCGPLALALNACGASAMLSAKGSAGAPPPTDAAESAPTASGEQQLFGMQQEASAPEAPPPAPTVAVAQADVALHKRAEPDGDSSVKSKQTGPEAPNGTPGQAPPRAVASPREMLDIEAHVEMQVPSSKRAAKALHQLAARVGGVVTAERIDSASSYGTATLTLRVPSSATQGVFDELEKLGTVVSQTVTARDVSKEYFDSALRLSSLEATLRRYEEILGKASKVDEILRIEQEMARIRTEIEQVKGNLRWLSDRVARATLHLTLREKMPAIVSSEEPVAKFFPGLRAPLLVDFGTADEQTYAGGGASLRFARVFSIDLDVLKRFDSDKRGPDAFLVTAGGEIYSELLGAGQRHYLNPYLGWRAGYGRFDKDDQAVLGATVGIELYKNRFFNLDVEARNYFAFGGDRGGHYVLVPALAAGIAF